MGYYTGKREHPCPRCKGAVYTLFISVTPITFHQRCVSCGAEEYTKEEEKLLGENISRDGNVVEISDRR